jgi:hypothetical protein
MKRIKLISGSIIMLAAVTTSGFLTSAESTSIQRETKASPDMEETNILTAAPEVQATDNATSSKQRIQLALLLDTSNSMDGLIDQAKAQLWNIVNELAKAKRDSTDADVTIALYEYGNDGLSVTNGYIRKVVPFTSDLDEISEKLFALTTNGGSEYCGNVISTSLDELTWTESDSAFKVIYIAGNEPFNQGPVKFESACGKAKSSHVVINTIFCGDYQSGIHGSWQKGAILANGKYMNIDSDKKAIQVATPYDDQIIQLNTQLNNTYVYYGTVGASSKQKQVTQDANSGKYSKANTAKRTVSKSSKMYKNRHWDLVDAYEKDKTIVQKIDKSTLPSDLKQKTNQELEVHIKTKTLERDKVKKDIADLGVKREIYIKETIAADNSNDNTLGSTVVKTIRSQASKKGFVFK